MQNLVASIVANFNWRVHLLHRYLSFKSFFLHCTWKSTRDVLFESFYVEKWKFLFHFCYFVSFFFSSLADWPNKRFASWNHAPFPFKGLKLLLAMYRLQIDDILFPKSSTCWKNWTKMSSSKAFPKQKWFANLSSDT